MKELTAFELRFIVKELSILEGAKLDKIYNPQKNEFIFRFHVRNKGKKILRILLPNLLYLTELKQDYPEPS